MERWQHVCQQLEAKGIDPDVRYKADPGGHPELKQPDPPDGFNFRDVWYDLSPMRPDDFGRQVAARWTRAETIKRAFDRGRMLERGVRNRAAESAAKSKDAIERMKAEMGG